ncbi:TetR/AcrR family transcriptional regulator [Curtobacterium sp. MCSS17_015]|uniref:TetR/AcrR family transcriptional regulator n=1 Tax=Curtobacterium sp. MCSS17_015 TaxID=2175666 RepID=UPI000DA918CA|nr:TetR/AcrR family transcriptional regulator [Curtobacterium sp. MCSS17_015]WIB27162.1 TetR/AcrR family transcriptional regulator [Curtobacterium sp. MCSS17_015]
MNDRPTGRPRTIDPDAVSLVALRLFDERGYDSVSMDDVAAEAGVSRRSLFRLFPTKGALVWGGLDEFRERFEDALTDRPTDEPAATALRGAYRVAATFPTDALEVTRRRLRVIGANPSLRQEGAFFVTELEHTLVAFVAARDGVPEDDLGVQVRCAVFAAAADAALTWWARHGEGGPEEVVDGVLAELG